MTITYQPQYRVNGTTTWINWGAETSSLTATIGANPPGPALALNTPYDVRVLADDGINQVPSNILIVTTLDASSLESAEGFTVTALGTTIFASLVLGQVDNNTSANQFNQFSLVNSGVNNPNIQMINSGGATTVSGGLVSKLVYHNHTLFQMNTSNNWYFWDTRLATPGWSNIFSFGIPVLAPTTYTGGATAGSTVGTISVTESGTDLFMSGVFGGQLQLGGADSANFVISGFNLNVAAGHTLSNANQTYNITITASIPAGSTQVGNPTTLTQALVQSNQLLAVAFATPNPTIPPNSPINTVVSALNITMTSGTFAGTLSVNDSTNFQFSGTNLVTKVANLTGTFSNIIVTATQNTQTVQSAANTVTVGTVSNGLTVPPAIVGASPTYSVSFFDDFTTNTLAPSNTSTWGGGVNWFWTGINGTANDGEASINTSLLASQVNNGNSGGGANASAQGGILQLFHSQFGTGANAMLTTLPALQNQNLTITPGQGNWKHFYVEWYVQLNPNCINGNGWSGVWGWSTKDLRGFGWGSSTYNDTAHATETDFFEWPGGNWSPPGCAIHTPPANLAAANTEGNSHSAVDSNWHTIGFFWQGNGTTGTVKTYYDNVQFGSTIPTANTGVLTSGTAYNLEGCSQFLAISASGSKTTPWLTNIDWVRVWQNGT